MDIRQILVVARREYITTVKRREFLLVTIGLPLFYLLIAFVVGAATFATAKASESRQAPPVVGFFDQSGALNRGALTGKQDGLNGQVFESEQAGQQAIRDKKIRAFVSVPSDFATSGKVTVYRDGDSSGMMASPRGERESARYGNALKTALLLQSGVTSETARRALEPVQATTLRLNRKTNQFEKPDLVREISRYVVPYAFGMLLMLSILISSSYLLHGLIDEKENRAIEILLTSLTHGELLAGKMIGLGLAGLTQIGIWALGGAIPLLFSARFAPYLANVSISPLVWVTAIVMFLLGFALYSALMAGVGSLGTSWRESQQLSSVAVTFSVIPFMLFSAIVELPDGILARCLSLFPMTAPIGMMLRVGAEGGSWWELGLASVLLLFAIWIVIVVASRLFRMSLLMYGQKPSPKEVWKALVYRAA